MVWYTLENKWNQIWNSEVRMKIRNGWKINCNMHFLVLIFRIQLNFYESNRQSEYTCLALMPQNHFWLTGIFASDSIILLLYSYEYMIGLILDYMNPCRGPSGVSFYAKVHVFFSNLQAFTFCRQSNLIWAILNNIYSWSCVIFSYAWCLSGFKLNPI